VEEFPTSYKKVRLKPNQEKIMTNKLDAKQQVVSVFLDLKMTFDSVDTQCIS